MKSRSRHWAPCAPSRSVTVQVEGIEVMLPDAAFAFMHDMMVTDNYYVVFENPIRMDFQKLVTKYVFGQACIAECLYLDKSRQTKVRLLPWMRQLAARDAGHCRLGQEMVWSFGNCHPEKVPQLLTLTRSDLDQI